MNDKGDGSLGFVALFLVAVVALGACGGETAATRDAGHDGGSPGLDAGPFRDASVRDAGGPAATDAQVDAGADAAVEQSHVYDLRSFWPFPTDKVFVFVYYLPGSAALTGELEELRHRWWPDGQHFTAHHSYGHVDTMPVPPWCPRVDDVFFWDGDTLLYTDTFNFFPEPSHTRYYAPGHVWATAVMRAGDEAGEDSLGSVSTMTHDDCTVAEETIVSTDSPVRMARSLTDGLRDWSPWSGGATEPVAVVRLDERTFVGRNPDDWWLEQWYFEDHPGLGFVCIRSAGYRKPAGADIEPLWDMRLAEIRDAE